MKRFICSIALLCLVSLQCAFSQIAREVTNVGIMLPLHNVNGDGRRMLEYYRGFLMAVEKLKQEGRNVNIHAWNVPEDADIRSTLLQEGANTCNVIFGPLYTKQVRQLSDFCRAYNITMVIPFSINGNDVDYNPMIYQVYQSKDDFDAATVQQIVSHFNNCHLVFVDCNDSTSRKGTFTYSLRKSLEANNIGYNITNLNSPDDAFAKSFSLSQPNLVILNTGRSPELTLAMNKLDRLLQANQNVSVTLFGYTEWLMYQHLNKERFSKYNAFIPTHFYYNEASSLTREIEQKYRWRFHQDMMYAQPRFALMGYDHAMFFLSANRQWVQTPLKFVKQPNGGYRNKSFMLVHYKQDGGIEAITE